MSENNFWLGAYLYYGEPKEQLLSEVVRPFAARMLAEKLADQFFFIRYWEHGPHIRLRFKGSEYPLTQVLKPELEGCFNHYLMAHPSRREEPAAKRSLPPDQQWLYNNTIRYVPYEPEVRRYGGQIGIDIAERQFQLSSQAVLMLVASSSEWTYERALGAAIQLHLSLAWALGMTLVETRYFYSRIFEGWLIRAYDFSPHHSVEKNKARRQMTLTAFAQTFARQKDLLVGYHRHFWEALTSGRPIEQEWLGDWLRGMEQLGGELKTAAAYNQLVYPQGLEPDPTIPVPLPRQRLWSILDSYVHMTNNRLAILNRDEAYLGYLIVKSLEQLETMPLGEIA